MGWIIATGVLFAMVLVLSLLLYVATTTADPPEMKYRTVDIPQPQTAAEVARLRVAVRQLEVELANVKTDNAELAERNRVYDRDNRQLATDLNRCRGLVVRAGLLLRQIAAPEPAPDAADRPG